MKVTIDKGTKTPFVFHYKEENDFIRLCDAKFKFKIKAKVIKGAYENLECLTVGLKVVDELLNPITIVPVFFNDNERMHFMENISVYADLMTLYWLWMNQSLPLSPNYVNFGVHSFVDKHYKEYSNVFTKDNSVITNHWLFKEFKKIIDIKV